MELVELSLHRLASAELCSHLYVSCSQCNANIGIFWVARVKTTAAQTGLLVRRPVFERSV